MAPQSSIFPIFLRAEYRNDGQGFQRFQSDAAQAAQAAKREFQGVQAALEQALSRPRNAGGSLDLGLDELRQAAVAQQQVAAAARQVAEATKRAATANGQFDASMSRATRAAFELANAEDRASRELFEQITALEAVQRELNQTKAATDALIQSKRRGTDASGNVINSARAERTAFVQLGQQLQDVGVQYQAGTSALTIFTQQLPQGAFALTGLANSTNKTKAAIGQFATILSGPLGGALVIATALLGPFILEMFKSGEAADESARAQRSLSEVLADTTSSYEEVTKALADYNREQQKSQQVTLQTLGAQAAQIASNLKVAVSIREKIKAELELFQAQVRAGPTGPGGQGQIGALAGASVLAGELAKQDELIGELTAGAKNSAVQIATEIARVQSDSAAKIKLGFDVLRSEAERSITDVGELAERLTQLNRDEQKALEADRNASRTSNAAARRAAREVEQLANLGERAAEQVQRINERFSDQPRLIIQAAQASRQLNAVVADISKELATSKNLTAAQREEFERITAAAAAAQDVIGDSLLRPFQELRRESEQRLQIGALIAQGRDDEAAGLQEIFRLEQQLGTKDELRLEVQRLLAAGEDEQADRLEALIGGYDDLLRGASDRVAAEQRISREYEAQRQLLELQADVARSVGNSLRDIFTGRGTFGDLLKNFRQSLQDLQGARLFEDLFGPAFRQIEEELRGNTPQGRANLRAAAEIETFADTSKTASEAALGFAMALDQARDIVTGAANDNGTPEIIVSRTRAAPIEIKRTSTKDIADRIAKATVEGFIGPLEDLLGDRFTGQLESALTGALAGFVRGGTVGGVLGGAKGILDSFLGPDKGFDATLRTGFGADLSDALGKGLAGAETGTQIDGIIKALGIRGSRTGGQIGGAIGSAIPIPGAAQVGAALGSIIGGLIKGTPRGSATIGGVGDGLGVTGTRGSRSSLEKAAAGLAETVILSVEDIASRLGASLDASRGGVSIGQRNDNIRVDITGRGITKTDNGAINFGEDTEAAIAFAVQDLIKDGVITGLRAAEQRLLQAGKDIESAIRDVLDFRSVFDRLKEIKDPVGFAVDQLNREFANLIDLFTRAGASAEEFAQLEELYGLERARAIEDATARTSDALRQLLDDLKIGDSGLSLRTRRSNALGQFDALAARVQAGDSSAFDDFAEISQQLLEIERQLFGSTQSYFDRLQQITALTETAIAGQTNVTSINRPDLPNPFGDAPLIDRSIDTMNDNLGAKLDAINANLILAISAGGSSVATGTSARAAIFPTQVLNF